MKHLPCFSLLALLVGALLLSAPLSAARAELILKPATQLSPKPATQRRAVVVGINYAAPEFQLQSAVADARAFAAALVDRCGYGSGNVQLLVGEKGASTPTRAEILKAVWTMTKESGPEDELLFFFSGHSVRGVQDDAGALLLLDATPTSGMSDTQFTERAVTGKALGLALRACPAHSKTVVLDADTANRSLAFLFRDALENTPASYPGEVLIVGACRDNQMAFEQEGHGRLTKAWLDALASGAQSENGLSTSALLDAVRRQLGTGENLQYPVVFYQSDALKIWSQAPLSVK